MKMKNKILIGIIIGLILVTGLVGFKYLSFKEKDPCHKDIKEAIEFAKGKICTQVIAKLFCPYDETITYTAKNGCEISFLEQRGWKKVEQGIFPKPEIKNLSQVKVAVWYQYLTSGRVIGRGWFRWKIYLFLQLISNLKSISEKSGLKNLLKQGELGKIMKML